MAISVLELGSWALAGSLKPIHFSIVATLVGIVLVAYSTDPTTTPIVEAPNFSHGEATALVRTYLLDRGSGNGSGLNCLRGLSILSGEQLTFHEEYLGDNVWMVELELTIAIYGPTAVPSPTSATATPLGEIINPLLITPPPWPTRELLEYETRYHRYRVFEYSETVDPLQDFC